MRTTHTGSLPRPAQLTELLTAREEQRTANDLGEVTARAVDDVVRRQADVGLTLVNDGEQGKASYATYVKYRLSGFDGDEVPARRRVDDFPEFAAHVSAQNVVGPSKVHIPSCNGPIALRDPDQVVRDVAELKAAAAKAGVSSDRLFMTAASPGLIANYFANQHYPDRHSYLMAIVSAMRHEYRAIVEGGLILQLDCPDLASHYSSRSSVTSVDEFRVELADSIGALNDAIEGLPSGRVRFHVCWGNNEGPHHLDIELKEILDVLLTAQPAGLVLESCNARHGHEWELFAVSRLPDDKYVVPGVIDTTTNFIEHPELVAQRIRQWVNLVGSERMIAGTDCGFATWAGPRQRVVPSIAWAKLESLVAGARLAS